MVGYAGCSCFDRAIKIKKSQLSKFKLYLYLYSAGLVTALNAPERESVSM